ncbi:stage III sporulation protein AG [Priestia koreensis]|uniref:Stage III sporulation protein AG n=1 Tax=Priestia koreensis TaxID=284581 RepID=A0A0M0KYU4_9BACI|nr:stage III sporulation protein AG [Priestia koreensis]KOO43964.1 hypothetical protein AMD01_14665 [Priestia koreensis]
MSKEPNNDRSFLAKIFGSFMKGSSGKKSSKSLYILLLLGVGIAIMLVGNIQKALQPSSEKAAEVSSTVKETPVFGQSKGKSKVSDYEDHYETQLKDALDSVLGVDDVEVVINLDGTGEKVFKTNHTNKVQKTEESDEQGGKRVIGETTTDEKLVILRKGDGEAAVMIKTEKPKVRGVLVVARGAENIEVKKWIIDAVTRVLDVPSYRVAVLPKKPKGD